MPVLFIAGRPQESRRGIAACRMEASGRKLGLLAFMDNESDLQNDRGPARSFMVPRTSRFAGDEVVEHSSKNEGCDLLIVSAHWDPIGGATIPHTGISFSLTLLWGQKQTSFSVQPRFCGIEFTKAGPFYMVQAIFVDDYAIDEIERNDQSFTM